MTASPDSSNGSETRLLVLTDDLGGGTGNHLLSVLDRWDRSQWSAEILSFAERTARHEAPASHTQLPAPDGPDFYPIRQVLRYRQVRRVIAECSPDLLHTYFFWPILYGRLLKAFGVVSTLVENREDEGFGWGTHEYAWLRLTRGIPDRVICVSEAVRQTAVEREGLPEDRTNVIHNGVEAPPEVPEERVKALRLELSIPNDAPIVGMVANLNRRVKGVDRFLDAVPSILDKSPKAHFVIIGGGPDEDALRQRTVSEGLSDRIHLPGYREDVDAFYELMDVSVLTSQSEGLSITLLESMSHGLPVVATRVGGNPEVVVEGETGYLVPPEDPRRFAAAVTRLLENADLRERMGATARQRARSEFSLDRAARGYLELYNTVLTKAE